MKKVKVGVIGARRIGKLHIENLSMRIPGAEVVVVADTIIKNAKEVTERFNIETATPDYKEVLYKPEVEAVLICSPTDTHAQYVIEAAEAGKHVFCEKSRLCSIPFHYENRCDRINSNNGRVNQI